jgi:hypothetical protein
MKRGDLRSNSCPQARISYRRPKPISLLSRELPELHVSVTETLRVELRLQIAAHFERALAVAGLGVPKDRVIDGVDQRAFFEGK